MVETQDISTPIETKNIVKAVPGFYDWVLNKESVSPLEDKTKRDNNIATRHTGNGDMPIQNTADYEWKHKTIPEINGHTAYENFASEKNILYQELVNKPEKALIYKNIAKIVDICTRDQVTTIVDWGPGNGKMKYVFDEMIKHCNNMIGSETTRRQPKLKKKREKKLKKIESLIYMPIDISQSACLKESENMRKIIPNIRIHSATVGSFFDIGVNDICKQSAYTPVHFCLGITASNLGSVTDITRLAPGSELMRGSDIIQTFALAPEIGNEDDIWKLKAAYGDPNPLNPYHQKNKHARVSRKLQCEGVFASHGYDHNQLEVVIDYSHDLGAVRRGMKVRKGEIVKDPNNKLRSLTDQDPPLWLCSSKRAHMTEITKAHNTPKIIGYKNKIKISDKDAGVGLFVCEKKPKSLAKKVLKGVKKWKNTIAITLGGVALVGGGVMIGSNISEKKAEEKIVNLLKDSGISRTYGRGVYTLSDPYETMYKYEIERWESVKKAYKNRYNIQLHDSPTFKVQKRQ